MMFSSSFTNSLARNDVTRSTTDLFYVEFLVLAGLMLVVVMRTKRLEKGIDNITERMDNITERMEKLENNQRWTNMILLARLDFWHSRTLHLKAPCSRPASLATETAYYYGCQTGKNTCALTGLNGTSDQVMVAHLLPCRHFDFAFSLFGLDGQKEHDGMRNVMLLCKGLEEAFDKKRVSFGRSEDGKWRLHIWDDGVKNKCVWKANSTEVLGKYEGMELTFPENKFPFTRILAYHHRVCFLNAKERNWIKDDVKMPEDSGSPFKTGNVPLEIDVNSELESYHSDNHTPSKQSEFLHLTSSSLSEETEQ